MGISITLKNIIIVIILIIFLINLVSSTQTYLTESAQWQNNLTTLDYSAITFGDLNNDNKIDLIGIGQSTFTGGVATKTNVYLNNGTTLNENLTWEQNLTNVQYGSIALGDINNDGKLDLALSGCNENVEYISLCSNSKIKTIIYINNGTSFVESSQWGGNLTEVYRGALNFEDINNDGKLDLILTGDNSDTYISKVYLNNGTSLVESSQWENSLTGITKSSVVIGDINNDGKLDLIISGRDTGFNKLTKVYLNNGTSLVESSQWGGEFSKC